MKIRIRGNSIRFRLTRGDVDAFSKIGIYEESIQFGLSGGGELIYSLQRSDVINLTASFSDKKIVIEVPHDLAVAWCNTELTGLEHLANETTDNPLRILVEKDFQCLHVRIDENETDTFQNPKGKEEPDASK